jgi:hypothetical protein
MIEDDHEMLLVTMDLRQLIEDKAVEATNKATAMFGEIESGERDQRDTEIAEMLANIAEISNMAADLLAKIIAGMKRIDEEES